MHTQDVGILLPRSFTNALTLNTLESRITKSLVHASANLKHQNF